MGRAFVAVVLALAGLLAVAHLGPVRRAVLRAVVARVEQPGALAIRVARLDYNLLRLRVHLSGVEVASARTVTQPFFTAAGVDVTVSPRVGEIGRAHV